MDIHAEGASRALDAIRSGGDHLIVITRQRISSALDALDEGNFARAASYLSDALGCVQPLSNASHYIAIADGSRLIPAKDLQVGMTLTNVGEVTELDIETCASERCQRHVKLKISDHEMEFRGDQEVYVSITDQPEERGDEE